MDIITDAKSVRWWKRGRRMVRLCKAKSRRSGKPCCAVARKGRDFCRFHGGNVAIGPANAQYIHGRFSIDAPARIRARMSDLERADPDLVNIREEILLNDARVAELLSRLDIGETGDLWRQLRKAHGEFLHYLRTNEEGKAQVALGMVTQIVEKGASDADTWDELNGQVRQGVAFKGQLFKMLVDHEQLVTTKQLVAFLADLGDRVGSALSGMPMQREAQDRVGREIADLIRQTFPEPVPITCEPQDRSAG